MTKIFNLNSQTVSPGQKLMAKLKKKLFSAFESPSPSVNVSWDLQTEITIIIRLIIIVIDNYMVTKIQGHSLWYE